MFKDCEWTIRKYADICTVINFFAVFIVGLFGFIAMMGGIGSGILILLFAIFFGYAILAMRAFMYGFADIVENSKKQSELLIVIKDSLCESEEQDNDEK